MRAARANGDSAASAGGGAADSASVMGAPGGRVPGGQRVLPARTAATHGRGAPDAGQTTPLRARQASDRRGEGGRERPLQAPQGRRAPLGGRPRGPPGSSVQAEL